MHADTVHPFDIAVCVVYSDVEDILFLQICFLISAPCFPELCERKTVKHTYICLDDDCVT